jgi:NAD-dependent dihydropyrimidine dehydrogenase PreA subunit/flavodoxin
MIFYFSATGNTRWAAEYIADTIGERLVNMANTDVSEVYELSEEERVGFCFPVHGWRPPLLVRDFISRLTIKNLSNNYVWALCSAGDDIGQTMEIFTKDLSARGIELHGRFSIIMPESYVGLPFMDVDKPDKEEAKKKTAKRMLEEYVRDISGCVREVTKTYKGKWPRTNSYVLGKFFVDKLVTDSPFKVSAEKCIQCGTCAAMCPVNDIEGGKGMMPQWKHNGQCLTCFNCYHHCPTHAIEYGRRTKNKGQYYFK